MHDPHAASQRDPQLVRIAPIHGTQYDSHTEAARPVEDEPRVVRIAPPATHRDPGAGHYDQDGRALGPQFVRVTSPRRDDQPAHPPSILRLQSSPHRPVIGEDPGFYSEDPVFPTHPGQTPLPPIVSRIGSPTQPTIAAGHDDRQHYMHPDDLPGPPPRVTFSDHPGARFEPPVHQEGMYSMANEPRRSPSSRVSVLAPAPSDDGYRPWHPDDAQSLAEQIRHTRADEPFIPLISTRPPSAATSHRPLPVAPSLGPGSDISIASTRPSRPDRIGTLRDGAVDPDAAEAARQRVFDESHQRRLLAADDADNAEEERQAIFDANEAERQRVFEEAEAERRRVADLRRQELARDAEERRSRIAQEAEQQRREHEGHLATAIRDSFAATEDSAGIVSELIATDRQSVMSALSLMDMARQDQRAAHEERERVISTRESDCEKRLEEQRERVRMLEEELARARADCERERAAREALEQEHFEQQRNEANARHGELRNELGDIANLLSNQSYEAVRRQELEEERAAAKEARRVDKAEQLEHLSNLVNHLITEREEEKKRQEAERAAAAARPSTSRSLSLQLPIFILVFARYRSGA